MAPPKKDLKSKFAPLLSLSPEKLHYINDLIFAKNQIVPTIKILQNDYGLFKDYKASTLRIYLHDYKKQWQESWYQFNLEGSVHTTQELPAELKKELPKGVGDSVKLSQWIPYSKVKILLQEAVIKFDAMQELERLAMMQYDRVIKAIDFESKLPTSSVDEKGNVVYFSGLDKAIKFELESAFTMMKTVVMLQMDLGIRNKVEAPQNHLHVSIDPYQQKLLKDFDKMKTISDITTQALELITKTKPRGA